LPKLITSDRERKNLRWDAKRKKFVGWQIDVYVNQGKHKKPKRHRVTYSSETEAKAAESRLRVKSENIRLGIERPESSRRISIKELFEKRLAEIKIHPERIRAIRVFNFFREVNADIEFVDEAEPRHFEAFIKAREASSRAVKRSTVNRELTPVITAFRSAPALFKELSKYQKPETKRPKFKKTGRQTNVSEREKDAICAAMRADRLPREHPERTAARLPTALAFELAWYLGLRIGEVLKRKKSDFNSDAKTLFAVRWKTNDTTRFEFLPEKVCAILEAAAKLSPSEFIFHVPVSSATMEDILRKACETCNLTYGRDVPGGITFHSNRHSFTTRITEIADVATAQSFTSHSNASMVAYYAQASQKNRRAAMESLYGEKRELTVEKLKIIFEKVRNKKMSFEDFTAEILGQKSS
jgi:integrase